MVVLYPVLKCEVCLPVQQATSYGWGKNYIYICIASNLLNEVSWRTEHARLNKQTFR